MQRQQSRPTSSSKIFYFQNYKYAGIALICMEAPAGCFSHTYIHPWTMNCFHFQIHIFRGTKIPKWRGSVGNTTTQPTRFRPGGKDGLADFATSQSSIHTAPWGGVHCTEIAQVGPVAPNGYSPLCHEQSSFAQSPQVAWQRILVAPSEF